jgi:hypothetical protein
MEYGPYSSYLLACAINTLEKISYQVAECVDQSATLRDGLKMMGLALLNPSYALRTPTQSALVARWAKPPTWQFTFASVAAISLTIAGGFYIWSHERLDYANISDNEIVRSTLPALAGLYRRSMDSAV